MTPHERLRFLATKLREPLPADIEFNMGVWQQPHLCGTAACAVGFAGTLPELQADGLEAVLGTSDDIGSVIFDGKPGFEAASAFFGISREGAERLFDPFLYSVAHHRITPAMVADRIDETLAGIVGAETAPPS